MTIRNMCRKATCVEVSLCADGNGNRSFDAERIGHFNNPSGRRSPRYGITRGRMARLTRSSWRGSSARASPHRLLQRPPH